MAVAGGGITSVQAQLLRPPGLTEPSVIFDAYPAIRDIRAKVTIGDGDRGPAILALITFSILAIFSLWQLRGITRSACLGAPFERENAGRLRRMGWAILLGGCALPFLVAMQSGALSSVTIPGVRVSLANSIDMGFLVYALVPFALASVFARGADLQEASTLAVASRD